MQLAQIWHSRPILLDRKSENSVNSVQSIMGATDRRRDGGTVAVAAGMVEEVLMREGVVAWEQAMNTVENAPS